MTETPQPHADTGFLGQLRALVLTTLAVVIILTAVLVGVGRALLPYADHLRPWIEQGLSERLDQEVALDRVEAHWPRLTPRLTLIGLQLADEAGSRLELDAARLEIHLLNLINRRANLLRLVLLGLEVTLEADDDGRWGVDVDAGAAVSGRESSLQLPGLDLFVQDALVRVRPPDWPELSLSVGEGQIQRRGDRTLLQGALVPDLGRGEQTELRLLMHHPQGRWSGAEGWVHIEQLRLADWLPAELHGAGHDDWVLNLEVWLDWSEPEQRLRLDLDYDLGPPAGEPKVAGDLLVKRQDRVVQAEIGQLIQEGRSVLSEAALARSDSHWALMIDRADVAGLHAMLAPWLYRFSFWPSDAAGDIEALVLGVDHSGHFHAAGGQLTGLALELIDPDFSLERLDLAIGLDGDRLRLLPSGGLSLGWPTLIRGTAELEEIDGEIVLAPDSLELRSLLIDGPVARAVADGWIYLEQPRPFLDFFIDVERVGPIDPRPYLPHGNIPPTAMAWLDEALIWVERASGEVNLHMRAGTMARDLHPGSYQARADFAGVNLDYWPEWPSGRALRGQAEFVGRRLSGQVEQARVGAIALAVPELVIEDLIAPELRAGLRSGALSSEDLIATLASIPVEGWQAVLATMQWQGPVQAEVDLDLPLRDMSDWGLTGKAELDRARLTLPDLNLQFDDLRGELLFDRDQLQPARLQGRLREQTLDLALAAQFTEPAWLDVTGEINPADLMPQDGLSGLLAAAISGRSHWRYRLEGRGEDGLLMGLESDLDGLELDWPAPLDKLSAAPLPFRAELVTVDEDRHLELSLHERITAHLQRSAGQVSATVGLGAGLLPLPPAPGLNLSGRIESLALDDWLALMEPGAAGAEVTWPDRIAVAVSTNQLSVPGLVTGPAELQIRRSGGDVSAVLGSEQLIGSANLPVPTDDGRALVVEIERLYLPAPTAQRLEEDLVLTLPEEAVSQRSPRGWPPLSLVIEDARRGELALGRVRLEAHQRAQGLEFELLDVDGPGLRLQGRGSWIDADPVPESRFVGRISTPSLTALLEASGYEAGIEADRAQLDLDVNWPGSPVDFAVARLLGDLNLDIGSGRVPEARPGAGRLLGLINFSAIPRRLMLDFRDVFDPGMRFDEISGRFELGAGEARTDRVVMRSPAADITISGKTDMATRRYDQVLLVEPGLGATLPVLGVLAGGPAGAAAGLVLRQVLDRPLRGVAEARYSITGPWDSPRFELIDATIIDEQTPEHDDDDGDSAESDPAAPAGID